MATITKERTRLAYVEGGGVPVIKFLPEGALGTHKAGAVLWLTSSSRVRKLPTESGLSKADYGKGIAGLALQDGGNSTGSNTEVPVLIATANTVFEGNLASFQAASAATIGYSLMGTTLGASCNGSRFYPCKKPAAATNSVVLCVGFKDAINDLYGRVYFKFLHCAFDKSR